jgi:hypothetical protein
MAILVLSPLWIIFDLVGQKDTLFQTFNRAELIMRRKWVAVPAILLVILNWIWNIYKGL